MGRDIPPTTLSEQDKNKEIASTPNSLVLDEKQRNIVKKVARSVDNVSRDFTARRRAAECRKMMYSVSSTR